MISELHKDILLSVYAFCLLELDNVGLLEDFNGAQLLRGFFPREVHITESPFSDLFQEIVVLNMFPISLIGSCRHPVFIGVSSSRLV